jgi:hypothetical protein
MFRALAASVALGLGVFASACNIFTGPNGNIAGNYTLQHVNGSAVPTQIPGTVATQGYTIVLQQGSVQLTSSKYISQLVLQITGNGQNQTSTGVDSGTYTVHSNSVTFTSSAGNSPYTGTMSGSTLSVGLNDPTFGSLALQFAKQ